jgi:hypothetical protein
MNPLPNVISGTGDYGLFQINFWSWHGQIVSYYRHAADVTSCRYSACAKAAFQAKTFDPLYNTRVAWAISHAGTSWGPWASFTVHGACH